MDPLDRRLLDRIQAGLALEPRPFAALGAPLGLGEGEVLERLGALVEQGVLRHIGGIFDTVRLGYRSTLVAARVPPERLPAAAEVINAHPGVSHSYERESAWNLWFTLAVSPSSRLGLEGTVAHLAREAGCERHRLLPALRVFKIGMRLDMEEPAALRQEAAGPGLLRGAPAPAPEERDRTAVRLLQERLPLVPEPFRVLAAGSSMGWEELLDRARALERTGALRRLAGLLHHRRAGFTANVMAAWAVPPDRVAEVGQQVAGFRAVSHCYERATHPDWPYSLFSMIHGPSRESCGEVLEAIAQVTGIWERAALWTRREWKKVRIKYFTPDYEAWEAAA